METLTTGITALDTILGGGLRPGSLVVLAGAPGTGKTILAQQIAFANATSEHKAIYYTTLSEPHNKMVAHLEQFDFFTSKALTKTIEFIHLPDLIDRDSNDGLARVTDEIVERTFSDHPSVVVVDSSRALHDFTSERGFRELVYDLASRIGQTKTMLLLVGEYTTEEFEKAPEFAVADGIMQLANERHGSINLRWLRVLKMRGANHLEGEHSYRISGVGAEVFPRLEVTAPGDFPVYTGRISTGVLELDEMIGGGLPKGDLTAVIGPSGVGKTVLSLQFIATGLAAGEPCLYVSFQETEAQLVQKGKVFGWDFAPAIKSGLLSVLYVPPREIDLDAVGATVRSALEAGKTRRVVLDSLAELVFAARQSERLPAYIWALGVHIRAAEATAIITDDAGSFGSSAEPLSGTAFLFQNSIALRYVELESEVRRAVIVMKMRDSAHTKGVVQFDIGKGGFSILGRLEGLTGLLGWSVLRGEESH
jgi:circadian clock protein KaiC